MQIFNCESSGKLAQAYDNNMNKNLKSIGVRDGMGGQGQYRLGRGSIGWARAVSAVPLPKSDFQHIKKVF